MPGRGFYARNRELGHNADHSKNMLQVEKAWRCNSIRRQFVMCCNTNPLSFQNYDISEDEL